VPTGTNSTPIAVTGCNGRLHTESLEFHGNNESKPIFDVDAGCSGRSETMGSTFSDTPRVDGRPLGGGAFVAQTTVVPVEESEEEEKEDT
jgi:hypothetical protein